MLRTRPVHFKPLIDAAEEERTGEEKRRSV